MSGLSRTPGKRVRGYTLRGFESRPLRQKRVRGRQKTVFQNTLKAPPASSLRGFFVVCQCAAPGIG
jgi:hypothetical protein